MVDVVSSFRGVRLKKKIIPFFIIQYTFLITVSFAQSPYQLKTGKEITLLGTGAVSLGASVALSHAIDPLTPTEIAVLNPTDINSIDRSATGHWSPTAANLSHVTLTGTVALAGGLALGTKPMRQDFKTVAIMYAETMLIGNGIERTIKAITQRPRPFVYNSDVPLDEKLDRDARQSFFSGHATNAFASAVFASEVFRHYFPHSRLKPVIWVGSLGLATATAVLRYEGGKHYPTDLIAGAAFGSLVGWGIPKLHEVKNQSGIGRRLDIQPWSSGSAKGIYVRLAVFSR
ncbi:phosphatase PAP2 family protein [Spirosoma sp.]|uniref:phosphatase PAP2 family protein n=1 Tax=Spirosoma sp. TaxID=1899569 RepID=UPI003B3AFEC6